MKPLRLDDELWQLIKQLKVDRIKNGVDFTPQSDRRLSKAIARIIKQERNIYDSLSIADLEDDRKKTRRKKI